ncbi:MAG: type VI secretion system tip protein VgrG [Sphingobacteriales bacterium]
MAASTSINTGALVTFTIKVNGSPIAGELRVFSVYTEKKVGHVPTAKIVILDGEVNTGTFAASSSATFVPGGDITIDAGYDSANQLIFRGIITGQTIRIDANIGSSLEVVCRDAAIKMTVGKKSRTFSKKKDSDIISSIIGNYPGLTADVTATQTVWPEQVQYGVSDWDFIIAKAELNGLIVTALNGKVSAIKPDANTSPVVTAGYGENLFEFNAELNSITQLGSVKASAWDYKSQAINSAEALNDYAGPGNLSSKKLAEVIGLSAYQLQTPAPLENADLTNWSKAELIKSGYSKIQGEAKFQGTSLVDPGKYITLNGLGDRFNGDHLISGVVHNISDGNWLTSVSIGLSPTWGQRDAEIMSPPAAGLLPGARGLFNGTVKKMWADPDSQYRILVDVPVFDPNGDGIWARLSNFYSTSGAGAFFLPEVGDEVVLGFLNEDPRYPIILGSMYSSPIIKPFGELGPNEKNSLKAIVSKSGIAVEFDDENKILSIKTPGNNTVVLNDKDKKITLQDSNGNSIMMSAAGITIKSDKDIKIEAGQHINLTGPQGIAIRSSVGDISLSGINIKETADIQYSAQGGATATINSGMELTLKSAMININ